MKTLLRMMIHSYKMALSPVLTSLGCGCRFHPSCSDYASDALERHTVGRAIFLIAARIFRCAPWHPGGVDQVPAP